METSCLDSKFAISDLINLTAGESQDEYVSFLASGSRVEATFKIQIMEGCGPS